MSSKMLGKFRSLERKLNAQSIRPEHYIKFSVKAWEEWANSKGMDCIPVNLLCGDKAVQRYIDLDPISKRDEHYGWVLYYELGAGQYIVRELVQGSLLADIKQQLSELWYPEWWDEDKKLRPTMHVEAKEEAVKQITENYRVPLEFADYRHIADQVEERL